MKFLSDNLLMIVLAIVLGISPLQTITASVSNCMDSSKTMHHQMNGSKMIMSSNMDMTQSNNQPDCCETSACDMSHCASAFAVVIASGSLNDIAYTVSNIHLKPSVSLISFYPSALYRPPKV